MMILSAILLNAAAMIGAAAPVIDFQPKDQTVVLYQQAAFGVIARGTAPLSYEWRKDGVPIPGATNDQIVLAHSQFSDAGRYSVVVSNAEGIVTSTEAVLTINPPKAGDVDCSFVWGGSIDGGVSSVVLQPDGKILIGGDFSTVHGAVRRGIARLNADGTTDYTFVNGLSEIWRINSIVLQSDGKVLIAGTFTDVNGLGGPRVARLNADGTVDAGFQAELSRADSEVLSVAVQSDGKVLIGGQFTTVNRVRRTNIARLNTDGTFDFGFKSEVSGGVVSTFTVQSDGKVLIGGQFTTVNGVGRPSIARLNTDGSLDSGFDTARSGVGGNVIAVQSDGKVLIGGGNLARLNTDGTLDTDFQNGLAGIGLPGSGGIVSAVVVQSDGKMLVGGASRYWDGEKWGSLPYVARLNADGTFDNTFQNDFSYSSQEVHSVVVQTDGKVLIGRGSPSGRVDPGAIQRLNADGTLDPGFLNGHTGAHGSVYSVKVADDGKALIGGSFFTVNGARRIGVARFNTDGSLDSGFDTAPTGVGGNVKASAVQSDSKVLIGGDFIDVNGVSRNGIARLNVDGTLDSSFLNGLSGAYGVASVAVQGDGKVLIGGTFTKVNGEIRNRIARLNADGTLDTGFLNGLSGPDDAFAVVYSAVVQSDGKILIGGRFTSVNGVGRNHLARLNADGTLDSSFLDGLAGVGGFDSWVNAIAVQSDGKALIGGHFTSVNGVSRSGIARLNSDGTLDIEFRGRLSEGSHFIRSIALQSDGKVLIGDYFYPLNGGARSSVVRLNHDGTVDSSFLTGPSNGSDIWSIAVQGDGKMLVGGSFTTINGVPAAGIARLWGSADIPPRIMPFNRSGAFMNFEWASIPGRIYRVQYSENLSANTWTDLTGDVPATGGTASKTDTSSSNAGQRFYRVVLLP